MKQKIVFILTLTLCLLSFGAEAAIKADVKNKVLREYYDNGKLRLETVYKNGLVARVRAFYRNGRLKFEERVKNGQKMRVASYYEDGRVKSLWTKKSGVTKYYHPNGKLRMVLDTRPESLNPNLKSSYIFSE